MADPGADVMAPSCEGMNARRSARAVRKTLSGIETSVHAGGLTIDEAAVAIVAVVEQFGLQAVEEPALPQRVAVDHLGVVCWMAVLPPSD